MSRDPISVIIPAHNEAGVIARCLEELTERAEPGELEVLVVCNGCTDDTHAIAERFGPPVRVLESPVASKPAALNLGDQEATSFPRFYLDADIVLPIEDLRRVADVLRGGQVHGAAPRMVVDLEDRPWPVRAFYEIWLETPYVKDDMLGCGVYAISEEGRSRFDTFPDIIADDCFIRLLFAPGERRSVQDATFVMSPPTTLRSLIHINVRRQMGQAEMDALYPDTSESERGGQRRFLRGLLMRPLLWPALAVYVYAKFATLARYYWDVRRGERSAWNRDDSSRDVAGT